MGQVYRARDARRDCDVALKEDADDGSDPTQNTENGRRGDGDGRRYSAGPRSRWEMVDKFLKTMYRTNPDFVSTVTRDFVRTCRTPVLILPDDIPVLRKRCLPGAGACPTKRRER
jgi:hypothetical protein